MRQLRRYGLCAILVILVVVSAISLIACSTTNDGENQNEIVKIRIGEFQKPQVFYGDDLDVEDSTILATTRGGEVHTVAITQSMISNYDPRKIGDQEVTITYEGCTTTIKVTVITAEVQGIAINDKPTNVTVVQGSELSLHGISLRVQYQTRSIIIDNVTNAMLRGYDKSLPVGLHTVYIEYAGYSVPLEIEVLNKTVISINIVSQPKDLKYFVGGRLDPSGLEVERTYDNGSKDVVAYNDDATIFTFDYDFSYERAYSLVKVTVNGLTDTFTCVVSEPIITKFTIDVYPRTRAIVHNGVELTPVSDVLNIVEGAEIDWATGSGTVTYDNGDTITVSLSDSSVYPFYNSKEGNYLPKDYKFNEIGEQIIQVRYGNSNVYAPIYITIKDKKPYDLIVGDKRNDATVQDGLNFVERQTYVEGEQFTTSFLVYNVLYDNGTYAFDVNDQKVWGSIDESMLADDHSTFNLSVNNLSNDGKQHINFTINGKTAGYKLTVVPKTATKLNVKEPYRNVYLAGSTLDLQGSYVYVEYNNNTFENLSPIPESIITVKDSSGNQITNFSTVGEYEVEVSIGSMSASFTVDVVAEENYVSQITLSGMSLDAVYTYSNFDAIPMNTIMMNVSYLGGGNDVVALSEAEIIVCDRYATGYQDIYFRYKGYVFVLKVEFVGRRVSSIEVNKAPNKLTYVLGEDTILDVTGLLITKVFNDGDRGEQNYFDALWSFEGYDLSTVGEQTVKVKYDLGDRVYYTSFTIDVQRVAIESISFDEGQEGLETITITDADGKVDTFRAVVVTYRDDVNLTYVYVNTDSGESIEEIRTLTFNVHYQGGLTVQRELKASYVSYDKNVNPSVDGNFKKTVEINYGGKTTTMNLYVVGRTLEEVSIYKRPDVLTYAEGQILNNEGGYIKRTYSDGTYDLLSMTNGLISINGYSVKPFEGVQGGTYVDQTVTIGYGGKTTSFVVRTYRKLHAEVTLGSSIFSYGDSSVPVVTIRESISGFTTPETSLEYLVNGSWVNVRPVQPGNYPVRIIAYENEYYESDVFEGDQFKLIIKKKSIIIKIDALEKVYNDADPTFTYVIEDGELVAGDEIELQFTREEGEDVKYVMNGGQREIGSYKITATIVKGFDLYEPVYAEVGLKITPKVVGRNSSGNVIDVEFITPNNYNSTTDSIKYTGSPIQAFGARFVDVKGFTLPIAPKDILYYDSENNLLSSLPVEEGTYKVQISDNYVFEGSYSRTFSIVK